MSSFTPPFPLVAHVATNIVFWNAVLVVAAGIEIGVVVDIDGDPHVWDGTPLGEENYARAEDYGPSGETLHELVGLPDSGVSMPATGKRTGCTVLHG